MLRDPIVGERAVVGDPRTAAAPVAVSVEGSLTSVQVDQGGVLVIYVADVLYRPLDWLAERSKWLDDLALDLQGWEKEGIPGTRGGE